MILYPIIILALLLILFFVIWRRAYILESEGKIKHSEQEEKTKPRHHISDWFHIGRSEFEPEAAVKEETEPNMLKAEDLFRKKQYISAERWYLEAIKKNPKDPKIYARLGTIYIEQKNFPDARDAFEEAIKLDDSVACRFFNLSYIYNSIGDAKLAMENAKRASRIDPENAKYRHWMDKIKAGKI